MNRNLDLVHIGPQKAGTTWLYECLKEHPQCQVSNTDMVYYFDIFYPYGPQWLEGNYDGPGSGQLRIDITPSYLRDDRALQRIAAHNPEKGVVLCLRNPIERAFSHYWHEKNKKRIDYSFEEVIQNYDLWSSWIKPGLYSQKIRRCHQLFGKDRVLIQFFEDLKYSPNYFFSEFCEFAGLDSTFKPSILQQKINPATPQLSAQARKARLYTRRLLAELGLLPLAYRLRPALEKLPGMGLKKTAIENLLDVDPKLIQQLQTLLYEDILDLQKLVQRDLSDWLINP